MSGAAAVRVAAVLALAYGVWYLLGGPIRFGAGAESLTMRLHLAHPIAWLTGLLALAIGCTLWMRYAWAWWLGLGLAVFQGWRIAYPLFASAGAPRLPGGTTLLLLLALVAFMVLLFMPQARTACNR